MPPVTLNKIGPIEKASHLVLLSGGLDSVVASFIALQRGPIVGAIVFDYGQRAAEKEIQAATNIARHLEIPLQVIPLPFLKEVTKTALVMHTKVVPQIKMSALDNRSETEKSAMDVWVPNRNGLFLNIAACIAEAKGIEEIVVGFNAEEAMTFPDNSANFVNCANSFFLLSTLSKPKVYAPTIGDNKTEIVKRGLELGIPFEEVWSCYHGMKRMCGTCESCQRSMRAYQRAGIWNRMQEYFEVP